MRIANLLPLGLFAVLIVSQCRASITLNDFSGSESLITFGSPTSSQITPNPFSISGVTIQVGDGGFNVRIDNNSVLFDNIAGASLQGALETGLATATVRFEFGSLLVNRAGLLASNVDGIATFQLRAYDSLGMLLDSVDVTQSATEEAVFLGLQTAENISHLELQRIASTTFRHSNVIDDIRFEAVQSVPSPASLMIWTSAALALFILGRRRGMVWLQESYRTR